MGRWFTFGEPGRRLEDMADLARTELRNFQKILVAPVHITSRPALGAMVGVRPKKRDPPSGLSPVAA